MSEETVSIALTCEEAILVEAALSDYAANGSEDVAASVVGKVNRAAKAGPTNFNVTRGTDFEVGVNIMHQDFSRMGQELGVNAYMLFASHPSEKMKHLTLINTDTGESVDVEF